MMRLKRYGVAVATCVIVASVAWQLWWRFAFGQGAEVVIRGKVLDPKTAVQASSNQTYVATDQGWAAIKVEVRAIYRGSVTGNVVWIENLARRGGMSGLDWETWQCDKGRTYLFALHPADDLSKWCQTEVFRVVEMHPRK